MATYIELQKQIQALQKEAEAIKDQERSGVIVRMKEAISIYGISPADLGFGGAGRRSDSKPGRRMQSGKVRPAGKAADRVAAFSDANGNTWGGRGPRPRWLREALAAGSSLADFARAKK